MKKNIFILFLLIILCTSCATKKIALERSEIMVNEIYTNIYNEKVIDEYLYRPKPDVVFCGFEEDGVAKNPNEEFLLTYKKYRQSVGNLVEFKILTNEYEFSLFPGANFVSSHLITVKLKCVYENVITEEIIYGSYLKNEDKCVIECFCVKKN